MGRMYLTPLTNNGSDNQNSVPINHIQTKVLISKVGYFSLYDYSTYIKPKPHIPYLYKWPSREVQSYLTRLSQVFCEDKQNKNIGHAYFSISWNSKGFSEQINRVHIQ